MGTDFEDTKLHEAVRYGDIDDVESALKQGDDPNQIGIYQWSALHEAANNGDLEIIKLLLKYGGNPNKPDKLRGSTAVHYAASQGFPNVLERLLSAGGLYDIRNHDGKDCLDVADDFECQKLLRKQRDKLIISQSAPRIVIENHLLSDTKRYDTNNNNDAVYTDITSLSSDLDSISLATNSSTDSRPHARAWGPERVLGVKKTPVLGYIQLSFEYNAKKETFKIRVWQIADILLPPPDTSMISSLYVKSYLQPDSSRRSKRKTEEVRVEKSDVQEIKKKGQDKIVNFQPGCFRFTRPLEYEKVNKKIVESRVVDIHVCITQRYTRKSFALATFNLPMSYACKKLVKEKFPLKPCISTGLPENMKVYNAADLGISISNRYGGSSSSINLHGSGSFSSGGSWATPYPETMGSDFDIRSISTDSGASKPSVEIDVPEDSEEEKVANDSNRIRGIGEKEKRAGSDGKYSSYELPRIGRCREDFRHDLRKKHDFKGLETVNVIEDDMLSHDTSYVDCSDELHNKSPKHSEYKCKGKVINFVDDFVEDEDGFEISVHRPVRTTEVQVHIPPDKSADGFGSYHRSKSKRSLLNKLAPLKDSRKNAKHNRTRKTSGHTSDDDRSLDDEEASIGVPSLTWDDYHEPPTFEDLLPINIDEDMGWENSVCLPMATSFCDKPTVHKSKQKLSDSAAMATTVNESSKKKKQTWSPSLNESRSKGARSKTRPR